MPFGIAIISSVHKNGVVDMPHGERDGDVSQNHYFVNKKIFILVFNSCPLVS